MIVSHLIGGLGNQMFQYAAGRALSLRFGVPLKLDISGFEAYGLHQGFELQRVFNCEPQISTNADIHNILGWQASPIIRKLLLRPWMVKLRCKGFVVEPYFHYWPGINDVPEDSYLFGYWQSEKYFSVFAETIRSDFTFRLPLEGKNLEVAEKIASCEAVSLHIRRGDYVTNAKTSGILGTCSLEYYQQAAAYISERISSPHFFVFSDDIDWARENLKLDFPCVYIDHNCGDESYRDMQLMSLCRHHIIANSSFSWWGAWLNSYPDKTVVAPKRWFASQLNSSDLIPSTWVRL